MIYKSNDLMQESMKGLKESMNGTGGSISRLQEGLVVVVSTLGIDRCPDGSYDRLARSGTGLQLTEDGFVLTAYHNIAPYISEWEDIMQKNPPTDATLNLWLREMKMRYAVIDQEKNLHPIDLSYWRVDEEHGFALIKAVTHKRPDPRGLHALERDLMKGEDIMFLGFRDQSIYDQTCRVIETSCDFRVRQGGYTIDSFVTDAELLPGCGGGVFCTDKGELAGLAIYSSKHGLGGAKAGNIARFIENCAHAEPP